MGPYLRAVACSAATGTQPRASSDNNCEASSMAVSPAGTAVYVTADSYGRTDYDYATVAYRR